MDAEVVLGEELVLVVPLQARRRVVDEPLALRQVQMPYQRDAQGIFIFAD